MGGGYSQAPPPDYWAQQAVGAQMNLIYPKPEPDRYPAMTVLPQGAKTEKVQGRFYIAETPGSFLTKFMIYELCDDLVFRTYGSVFKNKRQAEHVATDMHCLQVRATKDATLAMTAAVSVAP